LSRVQVTPPVNVTTFINDHHHTTAITPPSNDKHRRMQERKNARREGERELDKEGIYAGTKGALHYFFFILFY